MHSALVIAAVLATVVRAAPAAEPEIPAPRGFVTDLAHVIPPDTAARITGLSEELRAKTGAEIAVLTVETTAPLDDFTYAMRVAEAWKPGRKREDTGIVFLVATRDRKLRILVGYGLEGILPDGLVGEIEDREVVPQFRAGRVDEGVWRGVAALAAQIAAARGVALGNAPAAHPQAPLPQTLPTWVLVLVVLLIIVSAMLYVAAFPRGLRRSGPTFWGSGGFGGGGGGFGGFGGGSFGGGGAGRSW